MKWFNYKKTFMERRYSFHKFIDKHKQTKKLESKYNINKNLQIIDWIMNIARNNLLSNGIVTFIFILINLNSFRHPKTLWANVESFSHIVLLLGLKL